MTHPEQRVKRRMSRGKFSGISSIANDRGIIAALAVDQRGSLKKAIAQVKGRGADENGLSTFKRTVTQVLTPNMSAVLLDPEYALNAIQDRATGTGLLLAYEKSGYDPSMRGRMPNLLNSWSVARLVRAGANAIKFLMYYDADDEAAVNDSKCALVERIGAECKACDVPFFLELMSFSEEISDEKSFEFARIKPLKVKSAMLEFSKPPYGVDVLKVEFPVDIRYVGETKQNVGNPVAYDKSEALFHFTEAASAARVPFVYLSAGVSIEAFLESLALAIEARTPFSGVLCGRAIWQDGISAYTGGGELALRTWLENQGTRNAQALHRVMMQGAHPWWDVYGGKDAIEVVDTAGSMETIQNGEFTN